MKKPNFYADVGLDRAGLRRKDAEWLAALIDHPTTRFVPMRKGAPLMADDGSVTRAILWSRQEIGKAPSSPASDSLVLLGLDDRQAAYFAIDLDRAGHVEAIPAEQQFLDLRVAGPRLDHRTAGLLSYARGMLNWHHRHRYCGVCGQPTRSEEAGHVRRCTNADCDTQHFPRTDPVVIMLVTDGERCLLGRQKVWPPGMYSGLAGFVEPGESLEEAVAREVLEEAGIELGDIRYNSSQPWPFPGSLMLGFHATAATRDIHVDTELEDARWFERDWLKAGNHPGFWLPGRAAIARRLIDDWLEEE